MTTPAELSGARAPGLPEGHCIITRLGDGPLHIDRADPRVLISGKLLSEALRAPAEGVSLSVPLGRFSFIGSVLRIEAANRTVIYRIVDLVEGMDAYVGEWPD